MKSLYERMADMAAELPHPPFFASSQLFPADKAMSFTWDGRDHVGAHPLFWDKVSDHPDVKTIEKQEAIFTSIAGTTGIEIIDLDDPRRRGDRTRFLEAMGHAMGRRQS